MEFISAHTHNANIVANIPISKDNGDDILIWKYTIFAPQKVLTNFLALPSMDLMRDPIKPFLHSQESSSRKYGNVTIFLQEYRYLDGG
jgi:hypothetical protein